MIEVHVQAVHLVQVCVSAHVIGYGFKEVVVMGVDVCSFYVVGEYFTDESVVETFSRYEIVGTEYVER